jgi:hypothetical protein
MFKSFLLELNISAVKTNYIFSVNSNDLNTIRLDLVIKDNAASVDLTGKIVRLAIRKPDNTVVFQSGGVTDGPGGKCEFILGKQASLVAGRHEGEVMIYEGDSTVAVTTKFYYEVKRAVLMNQDVESSSDFPAISQAIEAGNILKDIDIASVIEAGEIAGGVQEEMNLAKQKEDGTLFGTVQERLNSNDTQIETVQGKLEESDAKIQNNTEQLAGTVKKNATFANASSKLNIVNYLGNIENIHPKVLYFPNKWNGWKYWMAYTPYPGGITEYENPCIACSPDGVNWIDPGVGINPLYPVPVNGYSSDTHLVHNGTELEVWWRTVSTDNSTTYYRRKSANGTTWTATETMFQSSTYGKDMISPVVIYEDGKYKLWGIAGSQIRYNESADGKTWNVSNEKICAVNWGNVIPWHLDVIHTVKGYEAVVQGYITGVGDNNHSELYYIQSVDNINYSNPVLILQPSLSPDAWDNQGIYRSSVVMVEDMYYVYYTGISKNNKRALSLTVGKDISELKGYSSTGTSDFRYKSTENGIYLPKVEIQTSGNGYRGSYLRSSKSLNHTAQILGEKKQVDSGGLQISSLYFDNVDASTSEGLLQDILGQVRRNGVYLEFYDGTQWNKFGVASRVVQTITAPATVDLDITNKRLIVFNGTGTVTINSITGGVIHEETKFMIDSSGVNVSITDNGQTVNPGRIALTLDQTKVSCNVMRMASTRWRTY